MKNHPTFEFQVSSYKKTKWKKEFSFKLDPMDFRYGQPLSCSKCALALAMKRTAPAETWSSLLLERVSDGINSYLNFTPKEAEAPNKFSVSVAFFGVPLSKNYIKADAHNIRKITPKNKAAEIMDAFDNLHYLYELARDKKLKTEDYFNECDKLYTEYKDVTFTVYARVEGIANPDKH